MFDLGLPTVTDPNFVMPPYLDPSIDNNLQTDWWGGGDTASRPGYYDSWTMSVQRELVGGLTVELDYNGSYGKDLPTGLITANQVPDVQSRGTHRARRRCQREGPPRHGHQGRGACAGAGHCAAVSAVRGSEPSRRPARWRRRSGPSRSTATSGWRWAAATSRAASKYHAVIFKLNQRMSHGLALQSSYTWSRIMTDSDNFGAGSSIDTARPDLEWSIGANDQTHNIKLNTVYELPFGARPAVADDGNRERSPRRLASGVGAELRERHPAGGHVQQRTDDLQHRQPSECDRRSRGGPSQLGTSSTRQSISFFNKAAFVMPVGALGNAPRRNPDVRRDWLLSENISVAKTFGVTRASGSTSVSKRSTCSTESIWGAPNTNFSARVRASHLDSERPEADAGRPQDVLLGRTGPEAARALPALRP